MCKNDDVNKDVNAQKRIVELKHVYEMVIKTRDFEITNLIQRNNFYMLFQGVLLASVFSNEASKPIVEFTICFAGMMISWYQIKVSAGAKYWQEYWEMVVGEIEEKLEGIYKKERYDMEFYHLYKTSNMEHIDNKYIFNQPFFTCPNLSCSYFKSLLKSFYDGMKKFFNKINCLLGFIIFNKYDKNQDDIILTRQEKLQRSILNKEYGFLDRSCKYLIISKPSVSMYQLKTAIILLVTWVFLFLQTINIPPKFIFSKKYNDFIAYIQIPIVGLYFLDNDEKCKEKQCREKQ